MRAMILAAGLGTRMGSLSRLRAKPALPVLGRPVLAWLLEFLAHHGVRQVCVNLHHLPETVEEAVERFAPPGLSIQYSREREPLGTGGGIAQAREFLAESDPCIVIAGDMILDCDLSGLIEQHRADQNAATLLMAQPSPATADFGTLGIRDDGALCRIADRFDLGGEAAAGVFLGVRILSRDILAELPPDRAGSAFEDLSDWWGPLLTAGRRDIRAHFADPKHLVWQPVGTPGEYLQANLALPPLSFCDEARRIAPGTRLLPDDQVVLGARAELGKGARLRRCVVWEEERVPADFVADEGVFAGGDFHSSRGFNR